MIERITPQGIHPPLANYSHAACVPPGARWLVLSGQLGIAPDGTVPGTFEAEATQCFENIRAILAGAGMGFPDLVRLTTYTSPIRPTFRATWRCGTAMSATRRPPPRFW